jgi:dihydrolipoamide dehydrogenase
VTKVRTCDLAIIGAGPGGYVAALRAAQLGMTVTLVERDALGGVCLNRGCIPTKAMLQAAALAHEFGRAGEFGLVISSPVSVDYPAVLARRDAVVGRLRTGVKGLLRHAKVDVVSGTASFLDATTISVAPGAASGTGAAAVAEEIRARNIIVATGSRPMALALPGADDPRVIDSDGALALTEVPARLLVVGGGAVGCEWSTIFSRLGADVTLVELLPTLLPREEPELSTVLTKALTHDGVTVKTGTSLVAVTEVAGGLRVDLSGADSSALEVDYVLMAAGRRPNSEGLALEAAGVRLDPKGWITTDRWQLTNVPTVLAIGDVTGQALLAHVASRQGIVAVEKLAGLTPTPVRADRIPSVTYTDPEVASVGLGEAQAREAGLTVQVGTFPFTASGRAIASGVENGLVKVVAEARFGRVLGVHLVGAHVGELLAEAVLALELEATLDELTSVIRAHPTLSETIGEAALAAGGHALHIV